MRNLVAIIIICLIAGCSPTISSTSAALGKYKGTPYSLPKGLVPVQVFVDQNGIGITIEPPQTATDPEVGTLVAQLSPSPFNNENIKIAVDESTGFLTTISSNSDAQLLAIVEEAAKSAARLALQSSKAAFLQGKVVVFDDSFDPLSKGDVDRVNKGLKTAISRAARAFTAASDNKETIQVTDVTLTVAYPNGATAFPKPSDPNAKPVQRAPLNTPICKVGLCVRNMTTRIIRLEVDGAPFAGHPVNIPERELAVLPVPSTVFADQDVTIGIKDGVVNKYEVKRGSEALGIVKIPGSILNGIVAGITQGLTDEKSIIDKRKDVAESETALANATKARNEATESLGLSKSNLQNAPASAAARADYTSVSLTVYPFSETLARAIKEAEEVMKALSPNQSNGSADLTEPAN
ncbi:hypothetical protein [Pelagibius sp.]|uniref:hypothetical protein n=1 Tax=Pelagibius sp. TaxID=1931238 RepID=UPI003B51239E